MRSKSVSKHVPMLVMLALGAVGCAAEVGAEDESNPNIDASDVMSLEEAARQGLLSSEDLDAYSEIESSADDPAFYSNCNVVYARGLHFYYSRGERMIGAYASGYGSGCASACRTWAQSHGALFGSGGGSTTIRTTSSGLVTCVLAAPVRVIDVGEYGDAFPAPAQPPES